MQEYRVVIQGFLLDEQIVAGDVIIVDQNEYFTAIRVRPQGVYVKRGDRSITFRERKGLIGDKLDTLLGTDQGDIFIPAEQIKRYVRRSDTLDSLGEIL